jgi:deoxyribodipyrimidine photo-lyase
MNEMDNTRKWHKGIDQQTDKKRTDIHFPTDYNSILQRIMEIDPGKYAKTRNFLNGAVTYLSPYISRGVISTRQVYESLKAKGYTLYQMEKMVSELAWRDFFQRVWQAKGNAIFEDLRQPQPDVQTHQLPTALPEASTGIDAVDKGIEALYQSGYMHNHLRMYTASIACNIANAHWKAPASWLYYHLLDGDLASNSLSWQWVAAAFSGKKYYCNQENISKYTGSNQKRSYLDVDYSAFPLAQVPEPLQAVTDLTLTTPLPQTPAPVIDPTLPILLYNSYNLDPLWRKDEPANRILLLEPSHFAAYPVSEKVLSFIMQLATENIHGIHVFTGEVRDIPLLKQVPAIYSKEHPAFTHYPGGKDSRDWLVPEVTGYFQSFFNYWKKVERYLK